MNWFLKTVSIFEGSGKMKIVAVTACPSGVAHTYMAAEALRSAAEKAGVDILVETQGATGIDSVLKEKDIREAVCVILTNDVTIRGRQRFQGKKIVSMSVSDLMEKSDVLVKKIVTAFA